MHRISWSEGPSRGSSQRNSASRSGFLLPERYSYKIYLDCANRVSARSTERHRSRCLVSPLKPRMELRDLTRKCDPSNWVVRSNGQTSFARKGKADRWRSVTRWARQSEEGEVKGMGKLNERSSEPSSLWPAYSCLPGNRGAVAKTAMCLGPCVIHHGSFPTSTRRRERP